MARQKTRTYSVLLDWWLIIPVVLLIVILVAGIPYLMISDYPSWQRLLSACALAFATICVVDAVFFSYYQLSDTALIVASQLRHAEFPYRDMTDIRPLGFRGLLTLSRKRKRFALSIRAFEIRLREGMWRSVTVSPADRDGFINHLMEHVDRERSNRATPTRPKKV